MSKKTLYIISVVLIIAGVVARMFPHPWNMTPIGAIALFASVYLGIRYSLVVFTVTMVVSDIFIGFYDWKIMLSVYLSLALVSFVGIWVKNHKSAPGVISGALFSSILFFIVTNFSVWKFGNMYVQTFSGLIECYVLALPFFKNALAGDLLYGGFLFGAFEFLVYIQSKKNKNICSSETVGI